MPVCVPSSFLGPVSSAQTKLTPLRLASASAVLGPVVGWGQGALSCHPVSPAEQSFTLPTPVIGSGMDVGPVWVTGATGDFWNFWRKGGFSGGSRLGTDNPEFLSGRRGVLMKDRLMKESWEPNRLLVASEAPGLSCPEAGPHVCVCYKQEPTASPCSRGWSSDINLPCPGGQSPRVGRHL